MSEARNPFDQFDAPAPGAPKNPFDQFDTKATDPGPMPAWLFEHGPQANILKAFGQSAAEGWGAEPLQLGDYATDFLRKSGVFNDLNDAHQSWLKTFNETMLRPAVSALATTGEAAYRGGRALLGGIGGALEAGQELAEHPPPGFGVPGIDPLVAAGLSGVRAGAEAFPLFGAEVGLPGIPHPPAARPLSPGATAAAIRALTPPDLAEARALGVIGEGEAGWKGLGAETSPAALEDARASAVRDAREAAEVPGEIALPEVTVTPEPAAPDIHQVARQIAPDTFREYDALTLRRDTYRRWLDDLADTRQQNVETGAPNQTEIADLQKRLETANPRMTRIYQNRLGPLLRERDDYIADQISRDSPDMTRVREALQQNDYRMRDLSPDVSAAYRSAQEQMPPLVAPEPEPAAVPVPIPEEAATAAPEAPTPEAVTPAASVPSIHDDVYQHLVAAGRPTDEADAAAGLVAAHYDARAARFAGALGTPEELYTREAPEIKAGTGQGAIAGQTVLDTQRSVIRLMGRADASTFIHETGHAWLEEMMRDAVHEAAPPDLIADAKAVRDWLGTEEGQVIPTRAHEKFARGFERYMMEGRAPSSSLARVFDQFKQWLTQIYQTVGRLRAPITDDIRDVYDRLIALPAREPVVAPDMAIPEEFAAEHEALAERTSPEVAGGVADRVRAEADRVALEKDKDVHDELAGRAAGTGSEATGYPPTDRGLDRNGPAAGSEPGAPPALEPVGAERARGGEAAAGEPRVAPGTTAIADANATYRGGGTESPYIDKAGNIRLDLLGTPEDINRVIRDAATENNEFIGARRGVISDAEVIRLADALGMDAAQLDRRRLGQAFNAEEVTAARQLLVQSATGVRDTAEKAAGSGSEEDIVSFAVAADRHRMIQEQVAGLTAEAGRALRAFAQPVAGTEMAEQVGQLVQDATGRTLNQLRRLAQKTAALPTSAQVSKFVAAGKVIKPPGLFDWIQSTFINALISGPQTHITYGVANTLFSLFKATYETGFQAAVGAVREAVTGTSGTERIVAGEIPAQLYGMMRGQRDGWQAAWGAFRTDQTVSLPGEKLPTGYAFQRGPIIPGPVGQVIEVPSRGVAAIHSFTRTTSYEMSIAGQAYRVATREGLTGNALAQRIATLTQSPTDEMMQEAIATANENALMQRAPYGGLTSLIQRITNLGVTAPDVPLPGGRSLPMGTLRPLKFVDPFVAISSNIIRSAVLERSPLGALLSQTIRDDLLGRNGTLAFDRAAGRMLAGTSFYLMAGGLASEGLITGSAPDDRRKADVLRLTGWQDHSVKIGETYYSMQRLGILGMQLGIAADLWNVAHLASSEDLATASAAGVHAFSQNILDESFMRGPSDLLKAVTDHERYGASFIRNFLSSAIPFSVGLSQVAHAIDPYSRQARSITDAMLRKIPWESETLYPFRDIWGEPMPNREGLIPGMLAIYESRISHDPVNQRLAALHMGPSLPQRKIRGVELTGQQYDDYARIAGRMAKSQLDKIVPSPGFAQHPESVQREIISRTISAARRGAEALIQMQSSGTSNDIIKKAVAAKRAQVSGAAE